MVALAVLALLGAVLFALWPTQRDGQVPAEWQGGYETGDFSQWTGVQAPPDRQPTIVRDPVRSGRYAARFELEPGDTTRTGDYESHRSEVFLGSNDMPLSEGDEYWFGLSVMFGDGFGWESQEQTVVQWKNEGTGSAPFDMRVAEDGRLCLADARDWDQTVLHWCTDEPLETGEWYDFEIRARFSSDEDEGFVELRHDGEPQELSSGTERDYFATLEPNADSYVKQGYYTGQNFSYSGVVFHDSMRIGDSLDAVQVADR